jgi:hypothetical protein
LHAEHSGMGHFDNFYGNMPRSANSFILRIER